ncbi:hypothetical protein TNCT_498171 [Trichonephila clavata]|uniref:Uncharacterized protein n=1 Tax=Trichonephila clavata TaxID=2740835 RepID=A0A8X6L9E6_TRICU|nr:hypothetical protein TNCT_498171 [Trichonephila clavata]
MREKVEVQEDGIIKHTGSINTGSAPLGFQSRGYGQPHQSHMVRFNERQQFNSQPRQFVQQNQHNFRPPRNSENVQGHR